MSCKHWLAPAALLLGLSAFPATAGDRALLGIVAGGPMGVGVYFSGAVGPNLAVGLYGAINNEDLRGNDPLEVRRVGVRGRYHWNGSAPVGAYVFVDLANASASFEKSAAEAQRVEQDLGDGFKANAGVGYQTRGAGFSFDVGFGLGSSEKYKARYAGSNGFGDSEHKSSGMIYIGAAFGL